MFVQNNKLELHAPVHVEGNFTGDPQQIGTIAASHMVDVFETEYFPRIAQLLQPGFHR